MVYLSQIWTSVTSSSRMAEWPLDRSRARCGGKDWNTLVESGCSSAEENGRPFCRFDTLAPTTAPVRITPDNLPWIRSMRRSDNSIDDMAHCLAPCPHSPSSDGSFSRRIHSGAMTTRPPRSPIASSTKSCVASPSCDPARASADRSLYRAGHGPSLTRRRAQSAGKLLASGHTRPEDADPWLAPSQPRGPRPPAFGARAQPINDRRLVA